MFSGTQGSAWVRALGTGAPEWRNEMAARSLFRLMRDRPGAVFEQMATDEVDFRCGLSATPISGA